MGNKDYTVRQLLEMEACTSCQFCADICPAVSASKEGKLSALYRMRGLKKILESRGGLFRKLLGRKELTEEEWKTYSETVFRCTLCGNCQEVCPVGIHLKELWLSLRQDLVHSKAYPEKIKMIRDNLEESHNVFAEDNSERADWVEDVKNAPEHGYLKEKAEVVYFTGCVASYFPLAQKIPVALAEILQVSGVDFTLLGEEEWWYLQRKKSRHGRACRECSLLATPWLRPRSGCRECGIVGNWRPCLGSSSHGFCWPGPDGVLFSSPPAGIPPSAQAGFPGGDRLRMRPGRRDRGQPFHHGASGTDGSCWAPVYYGLTP